MMVSRILLYIYLFRIQKKTYHINYDNIGNFLENYKYYATNE